MNAPWIKEEDVPAFAAWLDLFAEGQRALGYKAGLEAAVKVCRVTILNDEYATSLINSYADDIAALPVPEVQWRDLTDDEIEEAINSSEGDDLMKDIRAVIEAFKEKQL